jgi:ribonuclease R
MKDPHLKREAEKYDNPIPSRELIIEILKKTELNKEQLGEKLELEGAQNKALSFRLSAMVRDRQLSCDTEGVFKTYSESSVVMGKIIANPKGFGFVELTTGEKGRGKDLRLSKYEMSKVFHGEEVTVRLLGRRTSLDAEIVKVTKRIKTLIGIVEVIDDKCYLIVDDKRILHKIYLPKEKKSKVKNVVLIELDTYPSETEEATGRVISVIGEYLSEGVEIDSAILRYDIPNEFSKESIKESNKLPETVLAKDEKGRQDLTDLALITIDGSDSRDFDDAVFARKTKNGFKLFVAIADVSYYVNKECALETDAYDRGNSVYFPNRVVPMLPEKISNGLCSLNPEVKRLCLVCEADINLEGKVEAFKFYEAVMFSQARLTYEQVEDFLVNKKSLDVNDKVTENLNNLNDLYKILNKKRIEDGSIEFELSESLMLFNDKLKISKIEIKERLTSHKLIEECMLVANQLSARFLEDNKHPLIYRVHPKPKAEKVISSNAFLKAFGLSLPISTDYTTKDFQKVFKEAKKLDNWEVVQIVLLRTMQQAIYTPKNEGHFGLGFERYAHFTSPIRRYPDLLIHRSIKDVINKNKIKITEKDLVAIGEHCSMTERRADEATRDVTQFLKCVYVLDKVGEVFEGRITSVTSFGLFVELKSVLIEGLVLIKDVGDDYFVYDEASLQLIGKRGGKTYSTGETVQVQLVAVSLNDRKIQLVVSED